MSFGLLAPKRLSDYLFLQSFHYAHIISLSQNTNVTGQFLRSSDLLSDKSINDQRQILKLNIGNGLLAKSRQDLLWRLNFLQIIQK